MKLTKEEAETVSMALQEAIVYGETFISQRTQLSGKAKNGCAAAVKRLRDLVARYKKLRDRIAAHGHNDGGEAV